MLEEINQHQYNVLLQSLFFDVLVDKTFFNTSVKVMGKFCNSVCGMVFLLNVSSLAFLVYRVTCMQISFNCIVDQAIVSKNRGGTA
jgi:hypothetical protein